MYCGLGCIAHMVVYAPMLSEWRGQVRRFFKEFSENDNSEICIIQSLSCMELHDCCDEALCPLSIWSVSAQALGWGLGVGVGTLVGGRGWDFGWDFRHCANQSLLPHEP